MKYNVLQITSINSFYEYLTGRKRELGTKKAWHCCMPRLISMEKKLAANVNYSIRHCREFFLWHYFTYLPSVSHMVSRFAFKILSWISRIELKVQYLKRLVQGFLKFCSRSRIFVPSFCRGLHLERRLCGLRKRRKFIVM